MNRFSINRRIIGLVLIAGLVVALDRSRTPAVDSPSPAENHPAIEVDPGMVPPCSLLPVPAQGETAREALSAATMQVAARLREWIDDDDPERRTERTRQVEMLLAGASRRSIVDRLKIIEGLPADLMDFGFGLPSFQQWMFAEPQAAAEWMSLHPGISSARLSTLFQDWGERNRDELRRYLAGLPEGEWRQQAMMTASYEALPGDPVEAIGWARQVNPGGPRTGMLEMAAMAWARRDPVAAGRWVGEIGDSALRERLLGSLAVGFADTDPALAAKWVEESVPPGDVMDRALAGIAGTWARREPAAVGAWVARFPADEGRQMALGNLLNAWGNRDATAALAWARDLPDATFRGQAVDFLSALPAP